VVVWAWQPPSVTSHLPEPSALLALPEFAAASLPLPVECTLPEHVADPAGQVSVADPVELLTRVGVAEAVIPLPGVPLPGVPLPGVPVPGVPVPGVPLPGVLVVGVPVPGVPFVGVPVPGVPVLGVLVPGVLIVGVGVWMFRVLVAVAWQVPPVVVHSPVPVEVLVGAGVPGVRVPVVGLMLLDWSPSPVAVVLVVPLPVHVVAPGGQSMEVLVWLCAGPAVVSVPTGLPVPTGFPVPTGLPVSNRADWSPKSSEVAVLVGVWEPELVEQPPPLMVQVAVPVVARVTGLGVAAGVAGVVSVVGLAGVVGWLVLGAGVAAVWVLWAPVVLVAPPVQPVAVVQRAAAVA
jgi:hypothetical protein